MCAHTVMDIMSRLIKMTQLLKQVHHFVKGLGRMFTKFVRGSNFRDTCTCLESNLNVSGTSWGIGSPITIDMEYMVTTRIMWVERWIQVTCTRWVSLIFCLRRGREGEAGKNVLCLVIDGWQMMLMLMMRRQMKNMHYVYYHIWDEE